MSCGIIDVVRPNSTPNKGALSTAPLLTKKLSLLDLPPEIRQMIYSHILADAKIEIGLNGRWYHRTDYRVFRGPKNSLDIFRTCKIIYQEALPVFTHYATTLCLHSSFRTITPFFQDFIHIIPASWKANITTIKSSYTDFAYEILDEFPAVQQVHIGHMLWHVDEREKPDEQVVATRLLGLASNNAEIFRCSPPADTIVHLNKRGIHVLQKVWYLNDRRKVSQGWVS